MQLWVWRSYLITKLCQQYCSLNDLLYVHCLSGNTIVGNRKYPEQFPWPGSCIDLAVYRVYPCISKVKVYTKYVTDDYTQYTYTYSYTSMYICLGQFILHSPISLLTAQYLPCSMHVCSKQFCLSSHLSMAIISKCPRTTQVRYRKRIHFLGR